MSLARDPIGADALASDQSGAGKVKGGGNNVTTAAARTMIAKPDSTMVAERR